VLAILTTAFWALVFMALLGLLGFFVIELIFTGWS
jgi:hypothetical protein